VRLLDLKFLLLEISVIGVITNGDLGILRKDQQFVQIVNLLIGGNPKKKELKRRSEIHATNEKCVGSKIKGGILYASIDSKIYSKMGCKWQ